MRQISIGFILLAGCTAPYDIPKDSLGITLTEVEPKVETIPVDALNAADPSVFYTVKGGDTLFSIAFRFDQDPEVLRRRNKVDGDLIYPGQSLKLKGKIPLESKSLVNKATLPPDIQVVKEIKSIDIKPRNQVTPQRESKPVKIESKSKPKLKHKQKPKNKKVPNALSISTWQWPVSGPILETFSTRNKYSQSIKFGGNTGMPVKAAAAGRVVYAGDGLIGFGNLIILSHENQYLSAYGHNQSMAVTVGDAVKAGRVIATMGSTGTDTVKLHFEIRKQGKPVDPMTLLPSRSS